MLARTTMGGCWRVEMRGEGGCSTRRVRMEDWEDGLREEEEGVEDTEDTEGSSGVVLGVLGAPGALGAPDAVTKAMSNVNIGSESPWRLCFGQG